MTTASLASALDPRSIAIIGASDNEHKIGGRPLLYLNRFGYRGKIYPINPARSSAQGYATYPDLDALPEIPDLAIIAVPGDAAVEAVEACAARGVKIAVVMTSGFGETSSPDGRAKERRMVAAARAGGMRMVGPNSQGLANFGTGAVASFSTMFLEETPADGPIAVISQSGSMSVVPYGLLRRRGLGVRHAHATGNDADVTVAELAAAVAADPEVKLLLLYLESIPDPHHLATAARIAHARNLPIIALKSGRTAAGARAAQSHTGALANEDRVVDAFLEGLGILRADDAASFIAGAELYLKGWKPAGSRLVAISNSGASCVMTADAATLAGMPLATLSDETQTALQTVLPTFATTTNPVDITAALLTNSRLFSDILPIIARDPAADSFIVAVPVAGTGYDVAAFARDTATFAELTGKPIVVAAPQPPVAAQFRALGLATFELEVHAIAALSRFIAHFQLARDATIPGERARYSAFPGTGRTLNEADSLAYIERAGLQTVRHRLCRSEDEAVAAFDALGGVVALKGCSADVAHKSELGLVRLNVREPAAVRAAYRELQASLQRHGARFDGVLVAQMAKGRYEMLIGAHRDPVFGPVVIVGEGGTHVEALPDVRVLLPPFTVNDVRRAMMRLRIAPLFAGIRGEPPLDVDAFCAATVAVGSLMLDPTLRTLSVDCNPVLLGAAGEGYVVVDALTIVA
ncbi:MAG: acetate--CoA ligase family protein [Candidatus Velthaea sp.]